MTDNEKHDDGKSPGSLEEQMREVMERMNLSFGPQARGEERKKGQAADNDEDRKHARRLKAVHEFDLKPRDIRDYLDRFVIKQGEAKKVLSVAISDHYNRVRRCIENPEEAEREYSKHNIVLLGPTGVGKTYLMRCIARLIGVPFVKADATKFSETGYVGYDTEDLVRDLVRVADRKSTRLNSSHYS